MATTLDSEDWHASGILVVNAQGVDVEDNNISGVDAAISIMGYSKNVKDVLVKNNIISNIKVGISIEWEVTSGIEIKENDISNVTWAVQRVEKTGKTTNFDLNDAFIDTSKNIFPEGFGVYKDRSIMKNPADLLIEENLILTINNIANSERLEIGYNWTEELPSRLTLYTDSSNPYGIISQEQFEKFA